MSSASLSSLLLVLILSVIIFNACTQQHTKRNNKIDKITLGIGGRCYDEDCKNFAVSIDSSLNYSYYGCTDARMKGYYKGTISQGTWDTLNMKVESLHPHYNISDSLIAFHPCLGFETFIYKNGTSEHFVCFTNELRDEWMQAFLWISDSINVKNLVNTVPIAFETTVHNHNNRRIIDSLWKIELNH